MSPAPEHCSAPPMDAEERAILPAAPGASSPCGYGDRFAEDAFDYPSPEAAQASLADAAPADAAEAVTGGPVPAQEHRAAEGREVGGWRHASGRHQSVVTAAAALVLVGGFGFALSSVSDTVSSDPTPGGTAQVSVPRSPTTQPLPPDGTAVPESSGSAADTATPSPPTSSSPSAGRSQGREAEHGREDREREDDGNADD